MAATLGELADVAGAELRGDPDIRIDSVATLASAGPGAISFLANRRYRRFLAETRASAVVLGPEDAGACPAAALVSENPYAAWARIAAHLHPAPKVIPGIHPAAVVHPDAAVAEDAAVGPLAVIGAGAVVGPGASIGAHCQLGDGARVGAGTRLVARVTVMDGCVLGERCLIHPGVVIGADGFGLALDGGTWHKVPQLGRVRIGNDVEIGANTTIDRGALEDTVIGDGVKLDNLIQVGHNVHIGPHTVIAACTAIAGSVHIGSHCAIAGAVAIAGHIEIADHVQIMGMSMVSKSIREAGVYASGIPVQEHAEWRRNFARLRHLDRFARRLAELETRSGAGPKP